MSGDIYQIETRRRSRSKTPFLRSACDHENCEHAGEEGHVHHKKKKSSAAPNVHTIVEEQVTVTSSASSSAGGKTRSKANAKTQLTSDYSSDGGTTPEQLKELTKSSSKSSTVTTFITKTSKQLGQAYGSLHFTSTPRNKSQLETSQNALNAAQELRGSNGNLSSDHLAYIEYKDAGEYWNKTPKTDYTYSELSPHRRMLAPGVVAMPNMSRRSLGSHNERVHYMLQQNPAQEEFIRRRYEGKYQHQQSHLNYDSGDEVDVTRFGQRQGQEQSWWLLSFLTTIVTTISSVWQRISYVEESDAYHTYYARQQQQRSWLGRVAHGLGSGLMVSLRSLYLFIASVLSLDTLLLRSSQPENKSKKRFLLILLILLPLLLLTGWSLLQQDQRLYYVERAQALLPLSLYATLRGQVSQLGGQFKTLLSWPPVPQEAQEEAAIKLQLANFEQKLQKSLTAEEYENILNHVHSYVKQVVELNIKGQASQQQLTPQQTQIIVRLMRENLEQLVTKTELSEAELAALAARLKQQLQESGDWTATPVPLSSAQLAEIGLLIKAELQQHNHYTLLVERIDLAALLARILAAPQLAEFVDERLANWQRQQLRQEETGSGLAAEAQQQLIAELNKEIAFIKLALSDQHSENADLQQSLSSLRLTQEDLLARVQQHELAQDKRFSGLLAEIEAKLATLNDSQFAMLNKQIKLTLVEILGFKQAGDHNLDDVHLQNWVRSMFVAKEYLEQQLLELNKRTDNNIRDEIERSSILLMSDISERLKREILLIVEAKHNESAKELRGHIREEEVRSIVKSVLAIYDADKTGLVDFALESAGGQILSTRCTESYQTKSAQISVFGIPLWYPTNTPRVAISPNVQPGECWAFQGFPGFLVLKLNSLVYVTGFTLEHIPKSLSPTGRIDSAPRNFTVWGLEHEKDQDPILFGEYEYQDNSASLQYFTVQNLDVKRPYQIVELRVESNHGQPTYTCLYRFRVHGKPTAS